MAEQPESEERIVTLLAEKGKRFEEDGQAIASHGRSIVFLPKGVQPETEVRVRLQELREDSRGRMMYRGVPSPVEYTERWKDNGDGTASRVKIAIDWKLEENEVEALETRPLESREEGPTSQDRFSLQWGADLASTFVEKVEVKVYPIMTEYVHTDGKVFWKRTGSREESGPPELLPVTKVEALAGWIASREWHTNRFAIQWEPSRPVEVTVHFADNSTVHATTFGQMPEWWQKEQEARYSLCSCGRQRRDVQVSDGYAKCELCRAEETCVRCGKQAKVAVINGRLVCNSCQPFEEAEREIAQLLPSALLEKVAAEARRLAAGNALAGPEGEVVLRAMVSGIEPDWRREEILKKYTGYGWYYFTEDGIFGAKLAPAALSVLSFLPQATGNGLVELVAWIVQGPRVMANVPDYYVKTQVEGEKFAIKDFQGRTEKSFEGLIDDLQTKLESGEPVLADWLRGSEEKLQAALPELRKKWDATPGEGSPEGGYAGKSHYLEGYVKDFIELQYGVAYRNLGNAKRRHSVFSEVAGVITGNWEALRQARLTEPAINWLKGKEYLWNKDEVLKAFRGQPDITGDLRPLVPTSQLDEVVVVEHQAWLERRERDFWAMLATGSGTSEVAHNLEQLQALLQAEYSACPVCGREWEPRDEEQVCYCLEYEEAVEPPFTIKRSIAADGRLLVSVECEESDGQKQVRLVIHDSEVLETEVKTEVVWSPPSEEERERWQRLRQAEARFEQFETELGQCEGDYPSRVLLKFELDSERGTFFAIANVRELSVLDIKKNESVQVSGAVRFVCDPSRCKWLDVPPASGQTWVSSWGRMIGRDKKGRPIIIANPQARVDVEARQAIEAEIEEIKAEIDQFRAPIPTSEETASEQSGSTEEVTPDMLEALRKRWGA